jgi:hypothetical protein
LEVNNRENEESGALEQLGTASWPCPGSKRAFNMIRETGVGFEQKSLLLGITESKGKDDSVS